MTRCEKLKAIYDEAVEEGNDALAEAMLAAMQAAGCAVVAEGGGNDPNNPPGKPD